MADSPEESSWTFYIEGFIRDNNNNNDDDDDDDMKSSESPSLVSDADSSAAVVAKKFNWTQEPLGFSSAKNTNNNGTILLSKQNSFKKQKTKIIPAMDLHHDLEDTASSPVNSPKVSYVNHFMNQEKKEKAKVDVSEVKRDSFAVERDSNYVDLKRRSNTCGLEY